MTMRTLLTYGPLPLALVADWSSCAATIPESN
jgi:hypothetical protein